MLRLPSSARQKPSARSRRSRRTARIVAASALFPLSLAAVGAVAFAAAVPSPKFAPPRQILASEPNVPSAVSGVGEALTLRPGSGPGPALQLASAHGRVRTIQLSSTVAGYDNPSVAIADSGVLAATWDTSSSTGAGSSVVEMAIGTFAAPPTSAVVLSKPGALVSGEQAFVTPSGTSIVIWNETDSDGIATLRAAIVAPGGSPAPVTIDADESYIGAGLGANGGLTVIEQDNGSFMERTIATDGAIGPGVELTPPAAVAAAAALAGELGVLVDGAGDVFYSWRPAGRSEKLYAVWQSPGGSFGPVQVLGPTADVGGSETQVALSESGRAVAVLTPHATGPLSVRFASRLGHFGPVVRVGSVGRYEEMPAISINGSGRTILAWLDSPASSRGMTNTRALVAAAQGTRFGPPAPLPVGGGLGRRYLGDAPLTSAAPAGSPELVTYGASNGARPVGQIAFLTG
jgi:hypothetical protein